MAETTYGSFNTNAVYYSGHNCYVSFHWERSGYDVRQNTHTIHYWVTNHYYSGHYRTLYYRRIVINGVEVYSSSTGTQYYDGATVTEGWYTISSYNEYGNATLSVSVDVAIGTTSGTNSSGSGSWDVTHLDRTTTVTQSQRSKTWNSISMNWSTTNARDWTRYKVNNGSWMDAYDIVASDNRSGYYTISNLQPSTTYTIQTACRRADSQIWCYSGTTNITTDSAEITISTTGINFGEDATVTLVNPSSLATTLVGAIDGTQIISQSINTGSNTITFTDSQLTTIFTKYGDISQSNTITMVLTATASNGSTSTANLVITFTGDRATVWINDSGSWKKGICWIKDNGTWKKGIAWKGVNGTWKKAL